MGEYLKEIEKWPTLANGLHYKWMVDYPAFSSFGTYELSQEEWENRGLVANFKGNSALTTDIDHQAAVEKAISLTTDFLNEWLGQDAQGLTLVCVPSAQEAKTKRRYREFSEQVSKALGMTNAYPAFSYNKHVDEDGDEVDELVIDKAYFKGRKVVLFDDIIASGESLRKFSDYLAGLGAEIIAAVVLGKTIADGYQK